MVVASHVMIIQLGMLIRLFQVSDLKCMGSKHEIALSLVRIYSSHCTQHYHGSLWPFHGHHAERSLDFICVSEHPLINNWFLLLLREMTCLIREDGIQMKPSVLAEHLMKYAT